MRISDWSSDVCSSDLGQVAGHRMTGGGGIADTDRRWMGAALALSARGRGRTAPNPNVGCVIVREGRVVGRGWTAPGGRPHAEAMALGQAGVAAKGATGFCPLETCPHESRSAKHPSAP